MNQRLRSVAAAAATLALAVAGAAAIPPASAYSGTPPWISAESTVAKGSLHLYNSSGVEVTSGSDINAIASYIAADSAPRTNATKATVYVAAPDPAVSTPETWATNLLQGNYTFSPTPVSGVGTPIPSSISSLGYPFVSLTALGASVQDATSGVVLYGPSSPSYATDDQATRDAYTNVIEIRMQDSGVGVTSDGGKFWRAVIEFNPTTAASAYDGLAAGAWRVVYPVPASSSDNTSTSLATSPVSTAQSTAAVTLNATVTDSTTPATVPTGSVTFKDGATTLAAGVAVDGTGKASYTVPSSTLSLGSHSFTAAFTGGAGFNDSTSAAVPFFVDNTAPTAAMTAPTASFQGGTKFTVAWSASDAGAGVATTDVRYARYPAGGGTATTLAYLTGTTLRSATFTANAGYRYCFSTRARDKAGNVSAWSAAKCTVVPFDDRAFSASSGWTRGTATGWLGGTYSSTTGVGKYLVRSTSVGVMQIGVIATQCATCGSVAVYVGSTKVGTISLYRSTTLARGFKMLARFTTKKTGPIKLVVTSSGKLVKIDAVAITAF